MAVNGTFQEHKFHPVAEGIAIACILFIAIFFVSYFIYARAIDAQEDEIKESLTDLAGIIESFIDVSLHRTFTAPEHEYTASYQAQIEPFRRVLEADTNIAFVYTAVLRDDKVYFVLDATPEGDADGDGVEDSVAIMEEYKDAPAELIRALREHEAVTSGTPYTDQWGTFVSGYTPLFDEQGEFVAVLGVDIEKSNYYARLQPLKRATVRAMVAGFFIAYIIGSVVWFLRQFAAKLNDARMRLAYENGESRHAPEHSA